MRFCAAAPGGAGGGPGRKTR
eukprot:COSAG06_NODE_59557_length_274_cov_0.120000_1_plen_20_part_10